MSDFGILTIMFSQRGEPMSANRVVNRLEDYTG